MDNFKISSVDNPSKRPVRNRIKRGQKIEVQRFITLSLQEAPESSSHPSKEIAEEQEYSSEPVQRRTPEQEMAKYKDNIQVLSNQITELEKRIRPIEEMYPLAKEIRESLTEKSKKLAGLYDPEYSTECTRIETEIKGEYSDKEDSHKFLKGLIDLQISINKKQDTIKANERLIKFEQSKIDSSETSGQ